MAFEGHEKYDGIVLGGGGIKGFFQLGALSYAVEGGLLSLENVKVFAGTSIGSVIALLLSIGYTPFELFYALYSREDFVPKGSVLPLKEIPSSWGLISMKRALNIVSDLLEEKLGSSKLSFRKLFTLTGKKLYIMAVNISTMSLETFSSETTPHLKVIDAVSLSSNIPMVCCRMQYHGNMYIDGGLLDNFPLQCANECSRVLAISTGVHNATDDIDNFFEYAYRIAFLPVNDATNKKIREASTKYHILSYNVDAQIIKLKPSPEEKMSLFSLGFDEAKEFFSKFKALSISL